MDLRAYYQKIREVTEKIEGDHVVIISLETPDGGRAGVRTEVQRGVAARMIVEGRGAAGDQGRNAAVLYRSKGGSA